MYAHLRPIGFALWAVASFSAAGAAGDFNGDGQSDILWRNGITGANVIWQSANSATSQAVTAVALTWNIAGTGDFDGDGTSDILWHDRSTGANVIWRSADSTTQQAVTQMPDLAWRIVGTGDYDGDGRADIAVFRPATGVWYVRYSRTGAGTGVLWGVNGDIPVLKQ